jgi:hypothetical protein
LLFGSVEQSLEPHRQSLCDAIGHGQRDCSRPAFNVSEVTRTKLSGMSGGFL